MNEIKARALLGLLEESVAKCVQDKAATALQLSGGLDSAVVQAIGKLPNLYCCTWPEMDNLTLATLAACGHEVKPVTFTREEMIEVALPEVARLTEGKGTWSQCCQWFMARAMAADGMKVELNGEGSDELFGGYARYRILYWLDRMFSDPHLVEYGGILAHMGLVRAGTAARMAGRCGDNDAAGAAAALSSGQPMSDAVGRADEHVGLTALIAFEDKIAAAHGLKHEHPFMDRAIVDFAHELTETDKINENESKSILRNVARLLGVPWQIVDEQTKRGLVVPPTWAPTGAQKWSRGWFDALMADEWKRQQGRAA